MRIFANTTALVALFRVKDPHHQKALLLAKHLDNSTVLISEYIFAETVTILSQKEGKKQAIDAGEKLKKVFTWLKIDEDAHALAWEVFKDQSSKDVSFVDCTTFALFKKGAYDKAFSFDSDFEANSVPLLG